MWYTIRVYSVLHLRKEKIMSEENKTNNVVVIQDNSEKKTRKLTWSVWIRGIKNYKWWVIGSTLLTGVVGLVGVQWGVNSLTSKLTATYAYNLATEIDDNKVERYVNGQLFDYSFVVSKSNMEAVKASDPAYKSINVNKIVKENAISVVRNVNFDTDANDKNVADTKTITYTITAKAKFFPNKEVGKRFVSDLIYSPLSISTASIDSYSVTNYVPEGFANFSYTSKVQSLSSQYNEIKNVYNELTEKFGNNVVGNDNGQTLGQLVGDFDVTNSNVTIILDSFYANGYVDYEVGKEDERIAEIKNNANALVVSLTDKESKLKVLTELLTSMEKATIVSTLDEESEFVKEMIKLKNEIIQISSEIDGIVRTLNWSGYFKNADGKYVFDTTNTTNACYKLEHASTNPTWVQENKDYADKLNNVKTSLESERQEATNIFRYVYSFYTNGVSIQNSGYVELKNEIHWVIGLIVGLLLGFVVSSFVTGEVEANKKEKEQE